MPKDKDTCAVVVSYVPCLTGQPGQNATLEEISKILEQAPPNGADACMWMVKNEKFCPYLLFTNAKTYAQHLKAWAENKPEEWFKLTIAEYKDRYGLALLPRFDKGIERFNFAYKIKNMKSLPKNTKYSFIFKPLGFTSLTSKTYADIKAKAKKETKMEVYLLETKEFNKENPGKTDFDKAISLGTFEVVREGPEIGYIQAEIKRSYEDETKCLN